MQLSIDPDHYDALQIRLLEELIRAIHAGLKEAGVTDLALHEATGNIAFSVATIIDGSRIMELDDAPVIPFLTFATDRNYTELVAEEGGSWMHEYVFGAVDDLSLDDDE